VFHLGLKRFVTLHLNRRAPFLWKRHVVLGFIALATFLAGMIGGVVMVYTFWRSYFITGLHAKIAIVFLPLLLFGMLSGLFMNFKKRKRKWLPIFHAANNSILLFLGIAQIVTGWKILTTYIIGR
jgi:hypothetical protein